MCSRGLLAFRLVTLRAIYVDGVRQNGGVGTGPWNGSAARTVSAFNGNPEPGLGEHRSLWLLHFETSGSRGDVIFQCI